MSNKPTIHCVICDTPKLSADVVCPACGSPLSAYRITLEGAQMKVTGGSVGFVVDQHPGDERHLRVETPLGSTSLSITSSDGMFHEVNRPNVGRKGDQRAVRDLINVLQVHGLAIERLNAVDGIGEDGKIQIGTEKYVIQVVTVPRDQTLWREARNGKGTLQQTTHQAVASIRDAIEDKCDATNLPPGSTRKQTILALDAVHTGTYDEVIDHYLARYGDPSYEFGIASVWLVGPSELLVKRIGAGTP